MARSDPPNDTVEEPPRWSLVSSSNRNISTAWEPDMRETGWPPNSFPPASPLAPGTPVEVWNPTTERWADAFEVEQATEAGYVIRRLSDQSVLPDPISAS